LKKRVRDETRRRRARRSWRASRSPCQRALPLFCNTRVRPATLRLPRAPSDTRETSADDRSP
jgi:hypothetical protein